MRSLTLNRTLVFYDGIQVFIADDQVGTKYLCTLAEQTSELDRYLCVPISNARLIRLLSGGTDLRLVYCDAEIDELVLIESRDGELDGLPTSNVALSDIPEEWLPGEGFNLSDIASNADRVVEEAIERSRTIIHYSLNPPEAVSSTKIYADRLSQATKLIQRLVRYAFRRAIRQFDKETRERLNVEENCRLEVFAFSPGSFTLHMQSATPVDMFGYSELVKALDMIDRIVILADAPGETVDQVSQIGGHFATAYKDLLRFIVDTETDIKYSWASPDRLSGSTHSISGMQAKPLYEALTERTDIGFESVILIGKLNKVDKKQMTWRLINESDQKDYSGVSETDLAGLVIETQRYELTCEERLEEERGTGREFAKLHLLSFREL